MRYGSIGGSIGITHVSIGTESCATKIKHIKTCCNVREIIFQEWMPLLFESVSDFLGQSSVKHKDIAVPNPCDCI